MEHRPYVGEKPYIFISYSHRDHKDVMPVIRALQDRGFRLWYDEGIEPGREWAEDISGHIDGCGCFIAFVSEAYLQSENCMDELDYAREKADSRLMVYLEDVELPGGFRMRLNRSQAIYRSHYAEDRFYAKLLGSGLLAPCGEKSREAAPAPRGSGSGASGAEREQKPKGGTDRKRNRSLLAAGLFILLILVGAALFLLLRPTPTAISVRGGEVRSDASGQALEITVRASRSVDGLSVRDETGRVLEHTEASGTPVLENGRECVDFLLQIPFTEPYRGDLRIQAVKGGRLCGTVLYYPVTVESTPSPSPLPSPTPSPLPGQAVAEITAGAAARVSVTEPGGIVNFHFIPPESAVYTVRAVSADGSAVEMRLYIDQIAVGWIGDIYTVDGGTTSFTDYLYADTDRYFYVGFEDKTRTGSIDVTVEQHPIVLSGSCGADLRWDLTNGALTITGTGEMDDYAYNGAPWYPVREMVSSVTVADGVTSVGEYAFYECSAMVRVSLPDSLRQINGGAFNSCYILPEVTVPEGVIYVGDTVFYRCYALREIRLPSTLIVIGDNTLCGECPALEAVTVADGNTEYLSENGILFDADKRTLIRYPAAMKQPVYAIPEGVTDIAAYAFEGAEALLQADLPSSVTSIGACAFSDCVNLKRLSLPDSVIVLDVYAFYNCRSLKKITVPKGVTSIGQQTFCRCASLTELIFQDGFERISPSGAVSDCPNLTTVVIPASVYRIDDSSFDGSPNVTVCGEAGSYAQDFAQQYGIPFRETGDGEV